MSDPKKHTPQRTLRVEPALWSEFLARCTEAGTTASEVLRQHMADFVSTSATNEETTINPFTGVREENQL